MSLFITQCLSFAGRADLKNNVGALLQATLIISPLFNPHTNRNVKITMCFFYGAINSLAKKKTAGCNNLWAQSFCCPSVKESSHYAKQGQFF